MLDTLIDRRLFLGTAAGAGALSLAPRIVFARNAPSASNWAKVQANLDAYVADDRVPGAAAAIGRGFGPAQFLSSGTIARDSKTPMSADSLFRVYSMTKPITGMAAMMLVEDGKIGLDQNIADFIPGFKNPQVLIDPTKDLSARPAIRPITVRSLLTHTAGLGYTIVTKGPLLDAYVRLGINPAQVSHKSFPALPKMPTAPSLEEFANRLATLPLIADPGTIWSYSVSLDLLGRIIEIAGGMPFDRFLQTRIFDPLGMTSSFFQVPQAALPRLTTNYGIADGKRFPLDSATDTIFADKPPFAFGGAGLVTSPRDYDRFLQMLAGRGAIGSIRVMKDQTARLAMSNLLPSTVKDEGGKALEGQGFGAGGRVTIAPDRTGVGMGTYGWAGAAATVAWVDPTKGIRACGFAQFMPSDAMPFNKDFSTSVYASL